MATGADPATCTLADAYVTLYPAEVSALLEAAPIPEIVDFLETQEPANAAALLERMAVHLAGECLPRMNDRAARDVLQVLDPGRAATMLGQLTPEERARPLSIVSPRLAEELRELMSYPEDSAGHLMDTRLITFRLDLTVREALDRIRASADTRPPEQLVIVDAEGLLSAVVPLSRLVLARPDTRLEELARARPPVVHALAPREEVVELLTRAGVRLLPVVDLAGRVLGVIRQEGLVKAVQEEAAADLSAMVGGSREERALSPALFAVRKRLPWLNINLLTAFLAAAVVGVFESTIAQFTALAVLLPVVAGQSGNTGAQALAVTMRGLALREIRVRHWAPVLLKEAVTGMLNGVGIALVTALGVYVWSQSWGLCVIIAVAMVLSMAIASVSGAAIPLVLTLLRQDPAQSSSIILTTVTDVVGFFSFLGLATLLAGLI
ncbi:MAG: magnesium transporter [Gammaproteobacteria bacterium]|nr:magnesium transporter [Gammaproteobacteria bacterium]NIR85521.1 magnesium transporter [Gammaproteobacteria bacterium]NIR89780.1 magnesium transporter [Gammaproteobacteria bacterium]NIU06656.1 magnesium transporter [Gammaproteobacteria bacterium]NIV75047.1 CBS domain-containing protein [Gammaproteobacteria bacterium]